MLLIITTTIVRNEEKTKVEGEERVNKSTNGQRRRDQKQEVSQTN